MLQKIKSATSYPITADWSTQIPFYAFRWFSITLGEVASMHGKNLLGAPIIDLLCASVGGILHALSCVFMA